MQGSKAMIATPIAACSIGLHALATAGKNKTGSVLRRFFSCLRARGDASCCILAASLTIRIATALLSVQLLPLQPQSAQEISHAVGCRFQVVVGSEQEWSSTMQVCIWTEGVALTGVLDAVPSKAQCIHGVVGKAMFPVTAHDTHTIKAAIVHDRDRAVLLSDIATIIVETNSAVTFKAGNPLPLAMRDIQVTFAVFCSYCLL
jgi:hypothetical protein